MGFFTINRSGVSSIIDVENVKPPKLKFPNCRQQLLMLGFYVFFVTYACRCDVSIVIVALVNNTGINLQTMKTQRVYRPLCTEFLGPKHKRVDGPFLWNADTYAFILIAFYIGNIGMNFVGGVFVKRSSGKWFLYYGLLGQSCVHMLIPTALRYGGGATSFIVLRIIEGMICGFIFPGMQDMLGRWIPRLERGRTVPALYAGTLFGSVCSAGLTGILTEKFGWESPFYVWSGTGLVCCLFWFIFSYNSPDVHPRISEEEREYIHLAISSQTEKEFPFPWKPVLTSVPFYALLFVHFSYNWGFYTLLSAAPNYMSTVLHYDTSTLSYIMGASYLANMILMIASGYISDMVIRRHYLPTTIVRRLGVGLGNGVCALMIVVLYYVGCFRIIAILALIIGLGINGLCFSSWIINSLDLAPNFAGMIMGLTNTFAQVPGIVNMIIFAQFLKNFDPYTAWAAIYWMTVLIYLFGTFFFVFGGSGRRQWWSFYDGHPPAFDARAPASAQEATEQDSNHSMRLSSNSTIVDADRRAANEKLEPADDVSVKSEAATEHQLSPGSQIDNGESSMKEDERAEKKEN